MTNFDYPTITVNYGPQHSQTIIDFIGFDYRAFSAGACALRDYVDGYTNPINGAFVVCNNGGQWSRQTVVTIYPNFEAYRKIADAQAAKMFKLAGSGR